MAIYDAFFGFRTPPFSLSPDPTFLFLGRRHREALAGLLYMVSDGKGFAMLTGEVGTGKTTLVHTLLTQLGDRAKTAVVFNPRLSSRELEQHLLAEFGLPRHISGVERFRALREFLLEQFRAGVRVLVVIDEAHALSADLLDEIRLLSNFETSQAKLLQILLVGQSELVALLDRPELRQLRQRLAFRFDLTPFGFGETIDYVRSRMTRAGAAYEAFTPSAYAALYRYGGGLPRLINTLCDNALLSAFARDEKQVAGRHVRQAARDLSLKPAGRVPLWERLRVRYHKADTETDPQVLARTVQQPLGSRK